MNEMMPTSNSVVSFRGRRRNLVLVGLVVAALTVCVPGAEAVSGRVRVSLGVSSSKYAHRLAKFGFQVRHTQHLIIHRISRVREDVRESPCAFCAFSARVKDVVAPFERALARSPCYTILAARRRGCGTKRDNKY